MKAALGIVLYILASIWAVMVVFKLYLAISGHHDLMGRGPSDHMGSAVLQAGLAYAAYKAARYLRKTSGTQGQ